MEGGYQIKGELHLPRVTKTIDFDMDTCGGNIKGKITLLLKDYGIKPYKATMGTLKIKKRDNYGL